MATIRQLLERYDGENGNVIKAHVSQATQHLDVSGITSDKSTGNMVFWYGIRNHRGQWKSFEIDGQHESVEPLCYPLLFPHGERGWSKQLQKCDFMRYLANRLLMPEEGLQLPNKDGTRMLKVNRFQIFSRLAQYYVVESVSRAQDYRLQWHKNNQDTIFGHSDDPEPNAENDRDVERIVNNKSNPSFLSGSFTGSPRHLKGLAMDGLALVAQFGNPTFFITATFNTHWPEVEERLLQGQSIFMRADEATQIFKGRLDALLHNLRSGKYFGGARIVYILRVSLSKIYISLL
jgi:hypothetical protein